MADSFWKNIKCVSCSFPVENPVQLPACFHILCLECENKIAASAYNINICCPKCKVQNARPEILQLISGVEQISGDIMFCDISKQHGIARWNCFDCGKNLCGSCRMSHKDHTVYLLKQPQALRNRIWEHSGDAQDAAATNQEEDRPPNTSGDSLYCPICNETICQHVEKLQKLFEQHATVSDCEQEGHVDKELKYFCKQCWIPVCGDCSQKGKHKLHGSDDISTCSREFITKSLITLKEKLHMLIETTKQNVERIEHDENRLSQHVIDTDRELNARKYKILEETKDAFKRAITDAAKQGNNILMEYKEKQNLFKRFELFLLKIEEALTNFTIDEQQPTTAQYVTAFLLQQLTSELIPQIQKQYQSLERPQERQLVLPEVDAGTITPPLPLARVGTEWKQMKLAFSFKYDEEKSMIVKSIVLTDNETCLLSTNSLAGRSQYDSIVQYHYNTLTNRADYQVYDTVPGDYFISQLQSGEIVASYSSSTRHHRGVSYNAVKYCSQLPQRRSDVMVMHVIKEFHFPPYSIATTKENNILLCVNADEKKGLSYLMLMNLLGKELKSTVRQQGANMISPNYVAVSNSGEICVSDTEGSSIAILDENLAVKERMNYQLPTSVSDASNYQFQPHGVCYDSYGRIIVADPHNSCLVRLLRAPGSNKYKLEPLLSESDDIPGFRLPKLVAMGKDSRLWVVCAEHILVFDYVV